MKKIFISIILIIKICSLIAQSNSEFTIYPNGLIYSEATMSKLEHIVDSLNLKYKSCDKNPQYNTLPTVRASIIQLNASKDSIKKAYSYLTNGIDLDKFIKYFPTTEVNKDLKLYINHYTNSKKEDKTEFWTIPGDYYLWNEVFETKTTPQLKKYVMGLWYPEIHKYNAERLSAIILLESPKSQIIPQEYAQMIQYGDCLIDTSASLYLNNTSMDIEDFSDTSNISKDDKDKVDLFLELFAKYPVRPYYYNYLEDYIKKYKIKDIYSVEDSLFKQSSYYEKYEADLASWQRESKLYLEKVQERPNFELLKNNSFEASIRTGYKSNDLDSWMYLLGDKKATLSLKRSYQVWGRCSLDQSPRYHLQEIALLSAETANWESFLKAHLDVMNDKVNRASDGSYAWAKRETYIKELEDLGLDIPKLLIGTCLRFDRPAKNHYFGKVHRIGRALAETKYQQEVESILLGMIQDSRLDDFNRYICYFIFNNYISYLRDAEKKKLTKQMLERASKTLPSYIQEGLKKID